MHNMRGCLAYISMAWRRGLVRLIPKPGKMDYNTAKFFRTISLISFNPKAKENIIDNHIQTTTITLHNAHNACRKDRSTGAGLFQL